MTDFKINVIIDPNPAVAGGKKVEQQLQRTEGASNKLRLTLLRTFGAIGLTVGIGSAIRLLADYSQQMSTVKAVTGATAEQFEALDRKAKELGRNTRFSAVQAAEGMELLGQAGFTAEEVLASVGDTLKLAQAGGLGLASAADIATSTLRGFRLEVDQTARVVDVLALGAIATNSNVQQLGDALKFVAPIAAGLGVSLEETTAAIGALSNAGLQGSLAGTGLRQVLSELESPSQKTNQILTDLGVTTDSVKVSQVGLTAAIQKLASVGVTTGQALEIFGDRGGPAFEVLRSAIPDVVRMTGALQNAKGTATGVADTMDQNLNGALLKVQSAFQGLILAAGDSGGLAGLVAVANSLATAINFLSDNIQATAAALVILVAGFLLTKVAMLQNIAVSFGSIATMVAQIGVIASLDVAYITLGTVIQGATAAVIRFTAALATNPFTVLIAGAVAAFFALKALDDILKETADAQKEAESGAFSGQTAYGKLGTEVQQVTKYINTLQKEIKRAQDAGQIVNPQAVKQLTAAEAALAKLVSKQKTLRDNTKEARDALAKAAEAQTTLNNALKHSLTGLENEARLLGLSNQEREVQAGLLKELESIQKEGGPALTDAQTKQIEAQIRVNQTLGDQAKALDAIRGPQEDFARRLTALQTLLSQNKITTVEFDKAVASLAQSASDLDLKNVKLPGFSGQNELDKIKATIEATKEQQRVESLRAQTLAEIKGPMDDLIEKQQVLKSLFEDSDITQAQYTKGLSDTAEQMRLLNPQYAAQVELLKQLHGPTEELNKRQELLNQLFTQGQISASEFANETNKVTEALNPMTDAERQYQDVLNSIKGPQEEMAQKTAILNDLFSKGLISVSEYNTAIADLQKHTEKGTTFGDGITSGLEEIGKKMNDIASLSEATLVNAFNSAEDALVEFATTGKFSFQDFASSILKDIARILARMLLLQGLEALGLSIPGISGKAHGGDVEANRTYMVGENGPEMFTPPTNGAIIPAGQTAQALQGGQGGGTTVVQAPAPNVNLSVVNVDSPDAARDAMSGDEGAKVIVNAIRKNRSAIKRELG